MDYLQQLLSMTMEMIPLQEFTHTQLAYGSTVLISIAPFLILFLFRIDNTARHRNKLRLALSFASGGLLGDAFLHLIPHSMGHHHHHHEHEHHHHDHEHDHKHDHNDHGHEDHQHHSHLEQTMVGLYIISGIVLFFIIEKFVHMVKGNHHHSHGPAKKEKLSDPEDSSDDEDEDAAKMKSQSPKKPRKKQQRHSAMSQTRLVSGILNLIADFLHNFTDGLAIGATFSAGHGMGALTAVTILLHEIPHEIGDYAILIQAGYLRRNAIALQLVTAVGALIGTAVGLHYGTLEHATQLILPITAGGFIYIATVSVIPELLENSKTATKRQTFWEMVALFVGIAMMYWIAMNE